MSVMALDSVTTFCCLIDVKTHVNVCDTVILLAGFLPCNGRKLEEAEDFKCDFLFIDCSNRNRSAIVRDLLSNNSLFVGQLYEDKSLALCTPDLIFFTTDLQTVNYYFNNKSLPELMYFLNIHLNLQVWF